MDRLKNLIQQYGRWGQLITYIERIELGKETDFSFAVENAKALLETIGKEICSIKCVEIETTSSINNVIRKAFSAIGYSNEDKVRQISGALATIGQSIGELRNESGTTSHGRSLEELENRNNKFDELTKQFLIDTTVIVASFLIRAFEDENPRLKAESEEIQIVYTENEDFNLFLDELYGDFTMGDYSYTASEILYYVDQKVYTMEYKLYMENVVSDG
ncbi:MAG: hypothetical protein CL609_07975 [Anaerolineaceae bacterium]|nr:hypothetical protein [Anaerolineaceae bacterium]